MKNIEKQIKEMTRIELLSFRLELLSAINQDAINDMDKTKLYFVLELVNRQLIEDMHNQGEFN